MTAKRAAVLRILRESQGHLTAEEIFAQAKKEYPGIVLATVYNNLHALADAGVIRRVRVDGAADVYDRTPTPHDHAVCAHCHQVFDLPMPDLAEWLEKQTGLTVLSYHLSVSSLCPGCAQGGLFAKSPP